MSPSTQPILSALFVLTFAATACESAGSDATHGQSTSESSGDPTSSSSSTIATSAPSTSSEAGSGEVDSTSTGGTRGDDSSSGTSSDEGTTADPEAPGRCTDSCVGDPSTCCGMFLCDPRYPGENYACEANVCVPLGCESDDHCNQDGQMGLECHLANGIGECGGACESAGEPCVAVSNPGFCVADDEDGVFCRADNPFACRSGADCMYDGGHCDLATGTCFCTADDECNGAVCYKG